MEELTTTQEPEQQQRQDPEPGARGRMAGRIFRITTGAAAAAGYVIITGTPIYQRGALYATACIGVGVIWGAWAIHKHMQALRDERDEAIQDLMDDGDRNTLRITRNQLDYYIDRTHKLEAEIVEARARAAEAKAITSEATYWTDKYRPTVKQAPDELGSVQTDPDTHKYTSASGRTGKEQHVRAYNLSLLGMSVSDIARDMGIAVSTASRYVRTGKHEAEYITVQNPNYDPTIPSNDTRDRNNLQNITLWPGTPEYIAEIRKRYEAERGDAAAV